MNDMIVDSVCRSLIMCVFMSNHSFIVSCCSHFSAGKMTSCDCYKQIGTLRNFANLMNKTVVVFLHEWSDSFHSN